jgi:hypothetical protein
MFDKSKRIALGVALAVPVIGTVATPPASAETAPESAPLAFCSGHAQTKEQIKAGEVAQFQCFTTFEEAMAAVGIMVNRGDTPETFAARAKLAAASGSSTDMATSASGDFLLAIHYGVVDAPSGATPAYMPVGPNCDNYGINIAGTYVDNWIRSTRPAGCSKIKHFEGANWSGQYTQTTDAYNVNLVTPMNAEPHMTSSLQYKNT